MPDIDADAHTYDMPDLPADFGTKQAPETEGGSGDSPSTEKPTAPEATPAPAVEDDPEIEYDTGKKLKRSALRELVQKGEDYTKKTQASADERRQIQEDRVRLDHDRKLLQEGVKSLLSDPAKYEAMRRAEGIATTAAQGPDPVTAPQDWVKSLYQKYVEAGWKYEDKTPAEWNAEMSRQLDAAQKSAMFSRITGLENSIREREETARQTAEANEVRAELDALYKDERYKIVGDDEALRELVEDRIARHVARNEDVELETVVEQVANIVKRHIGTYVNGKQADAKVTRTIQRGGGGHRAPAPETFGDGYDGFDAIGKKIKNGG